VLLLEKTTATAMEEQNPASQSHRSTEQLQDTAKLEHQYGSVTFRSLLSHPIVIFLFFFFSYSLLVL
jgi:hypothetical protein